MPLAIPFIIRILVGRGGVIIRELHAALTMDVSLSLDTFAVILRSHCYCKMYYKISVQLILQVTGDFVLFSSKAITPT